MLDIQDCEKRLFDKTGVWSERTGWIDYPSNLHEEEITRIIETAHRLNQSSDYIIVIGIWGSYIGSKAVIDACLGVWPCAKHKILYAGHHMDSDYHSSLLQICDNYDYSLIVISKSGTTLEPKLAFELLLEHAKHKYGEWHKDRLVCITDEYAGTLRSIVNENGYMSFSIPSTIGGRYSVATPVGLLPMACAGLDIWQFLSGMMDAWGDTMRDYILWRIAHYRRGKKIECMANFSPHHTSLWLWRQQLFWESEWKQWQGLFPVVLQYSTDLHSMWQYMQEWARIMIETLLYSEDNWDAMAKANVACRKGSKESHEMWWVPVFEWNIWPNIEYAIGKWMYRMMCACAISCYLAGVNPFDQPGVEWYKHAMKKCMNNEW